MPFSKYDRFFVCFSLFLSCLAFCLFPLSAEAARKQKILVLHSYHQGYEWTDNISSGIQAIFEPLDKDYEMYYEYLDTKRNPSEEYLNKLIELYDLKLQREKYDAIIVADNNALSFVKDHRTKYFQNTPMAYFFLLIYLSLLFHIFKPVI